MNGRVGPPLQLWHTCVPHDVKAEAIDALDWGGYVAAETKRFDEVHTHVTLQLDDDVNNPGNPYYEGSVIDPAKLKHD